VAVNREDERRLACGRELLPLVDQVAEALPPVEPEHQRTCPHCQAALGELEDLWRQVRALAREEIVAPDRMRYVIRRIHEGLAAPPREVRLEEVLPRLVQHAMLETDRGTTRIADSVVARIVGQAVRGLRGVHLAGRPSAVSVAVSGGSEEELDPRPSAMASSISSDGGGSCSANEAVSPLSRIEVSSTSG